VDARSGSLFPPLQELKSGQHARAKRSQQALSVATGKVRNFACSKAVIHERLKGVVTRLSADAASATGLWTATLRHPSREDQSGKAVVRIKNPRTLGPSPSASVLTRIDTK
jgi:hypothetical protein